MVKGFAGQAGEPLARDLARQGILAEYAGSAPATERKLLRIQLYEIVQPVVFGQLTRKLEINRGHYRCACAFTLLEDDCLDRFHDDMDAVLDDLFRNIRIPVHNVEGWVRKRLTAVTIDAYRRRRGARGALQRPRVPIWLATKLGDDERLLTLAVDMLEFAGQEVSAGAEVWPIDAWAARRATGGLGSYEPTRRAVVRDVDMVVAAMRSRPKWFDDYVERPLGRKRIPLPPTLPSVADTPEQPTSDHMIDALLTELAGIAVTAIEARLARGGEPTTVIVDVLNIVFGAGAENLGSATSDADARLTAPLTDRVAVEQLVDTVLTIVADRERASVVSEKRGGRSLLPLTDGGPVRQERDLLTCTQPVEIGGRVGRVT